MKPFAPDHVPYSNGVDPYSVQLPNDNDHVIPDGTAVFDKPTTNQWIHSELNLPQGELLRKAKVVSLTKDGNGDSKGSCDPNPFLNILTRDVEFSYGEIKEYSANVIYENIFSQVDDDDHNLKILDIIVNHSKHINAVDNADMRLCTKSG